MSPHSELNQFSVKLGILKRLNNLPIYTDKTFTTQSVEGTVSKVTLVAR